VSSKPRSVVAWVVAAVALGWACADAAPERSGDPGVGLLAQEAPRIRPTREELTAQRPRLPEGERYGHRAFFWTRAVYSSGGRGGYFGFDRRGGRAWATDYPKGDQQFLLVLKRLVRLDAYDWENAVELTDPGLRRYPLVYAVEVGQMALTPEEIQGLRDYLAAGGFLIVDDFWGSYEWAQFEYNISQVLPGRAIVDIPRDHPLFSTYYEIDEILQVPSIGNARSGRTSQRDGYVPYVKGIFDDNGELMVVINWNTDLGDAWEWAEQPDYPLMYSTFAYEMGANMIVYGMSH
jgi:hypothetical protein